MNYERSVIGAIKATLDMYGYTNYKVKPSRTVVRVQVGYETLEVLTADADKAQMQLIEWLQRIRV